MADGLKVLALFAHPDDAEFLCAGTLARLAAEGAQISIASMTAGDCGSAELAPAKISAVRKREAASAARLIGAEYDCLGEKDLSIFYDGRTLRRVMEMVRRSGAGIVFTHSPSDYMVDHETTSRLCQTACFGATARNYATRARRATRPLEAIPHLYYAEPFGQRDILGHAAAPAIFVDIAGTLGLKQRMLACHKSQRQWLRAQQGIAGPESMMREMARRTGKRGGLEWAEGFRQHLGQGFPQNNRLKRILEARVRD